MNTKIILGVLVILSLGVFIVRFMQDRYDEAICYGIMSTLLRMEYISMKDK